MDEVFGLKINLEKKELIPIGKVDSTKRLVSQFGSRLGSLPSKYLGLPLDASFMVALGRPWLRKDSNSSSHP